MGEKTSEVIVQEHAAQTSVIEKEGLSETERLRAEIEQTRLEMSHTLDEIKDQLSPARLREEAKERIREASIGRGRRMMKSTNNQVRSTLREHPLVSILLGASALWLIREGIQSARSRREIYVGPEYPEYPGETEPGYRPPSFRAEEGKEEVGEQKERIKGKLYQEREQMRERGGEVAEEMRHKMTRLREQTREKVSQYAGRTRDSASVQKDRLQDRFSRLVDENPLMVTTTAVALGAIIGSMIPGTLKEHELMGEQGEQVKHKLKEKAQESFEKAKTAAQEKGEEIKEETEEQEYGKF